MSTAIIEQNDALADFNSATADTELAVLVQCKGRSLCICVDHVIGHRQVVVTALHDILPNTTRLAGIAQLGSGRLAPVLNIPEILKSRA
jgi:chemotaxis protein histidine kinase CheA